MTGQQQDFDLLDAEVRWNVERVWPEVVEWNQRLTGKYVPQPGSSLASDDQQVPGMWVSNLAWLSLAAGSQHLMSTMRYLSEFGPVVLSLQSLLRTAIWGGAQAVWLLSPSDGAERVKRAKRVHFYSQDNYRKWLNTFDAGHPSVREPGALLHAKAALAEHLECIGDQPRVDQTQVVKDVATFVYKGQPDAVLQCEQGWRSLGAIAHALPWELTTRSGGESVAAGEGLSTLRITARWGDLGGDLGCAHEFLQRGWALLDERSRTGQPDVALSGS